MKFRSPNFSHRRARTAAFAVVLVCAISPLLNADDLRARSIGRQTSDFVLTDALTEEPWQLSSQEPAKAIVLYFLSTECPVTNRYLPTLRELHAALKEKGVVIAAIHSNAHDSTEEIETHANEFGLTMPVLLDSDGTVARSLGVTSTAEAILIDAFAKIRYRGPIDDRFERGVTRARVSRTLLLDAVQAVLSRRPVTTPLVDVAACPLNLANDETPTSDRRTVTYAEHAAQIIQTRCQPCHRPNGIGPFELMNFRDAKAWAPAIRGVLAESLMPPWSAEAPAGYLANDRSLTDDEYRTLLDWIDDGAHEGDVNKMPEPLTFPDSWDIGAPDMIIKMNKSVAVPADTPELGIPYKYIWAGDAFEEEMWVSAAEVHPGAPEVVHHASVYIVPPGIDLRIEDDSIPSSGFSELFSPLNDLRTLADFVPGDNSYVLAQGLAKRIPAGARLLFEMHYTPNGREISDRTEVGIVFADGPPEHEVLADAALDFMFSIPPGHPQYEVRARSQRFNQNIMLISMNAHMHYRGSSFRFELVKPSGERSLLLDIPRYSFDWQSTYVLADPIAIPKGSRIECTAVFDNSAENPWNPDPTARVEWGDQTWQEMMIGYFEYYEKD